MEKKEAYENKELTFYEYEDLKTNSSQCTSKEIEPHLLNENKNNI